MLLPAQLRACHLVDYYFMAIKHDKRTERAEIGRGGGFWAAITADPPKKER